MRTRPSSASLPAAVSVLQLAISGPIAWVADGFGDHFYRIDTRCAG